MNKKLYDARLPQIIQRSKSFKRNQSAQSKLYFIDLLPNQTLKQSSTEFTHLESKDFASIDKQQRQKKRKRIEQMRNRKRLIHIDREIRYKILQHQKYQNLKRRQNQSLDEYRYELKMNCLVQKSGIDPINLHYQSNKRGQMLQEADKNNQINRKVRAHRLQTFGNTGYDIINGYDSFRVEETVSKQQYPVFQDKIINFYDKLKIKLEPYKYK